VNYIVSFGAIVFVGMLNLENVEAFNDL